MVLDLKLTLLVAGIVLLGLAVLLTWRERRRRGRADPSPDAWVLAAALENAPVGAVFVAADGGYHGANAAARRLLDLPTAAGVLPDAPWASLLRRDLEPAATVGSCVERLAKVREECYAKWSLLPYDGRRALLVLTDTSDQQRAEREWRALLATLSHELQTPLTAVLAHSDLLKEEAFGGAPGRSVELIHREAHRIIRLVTDLMDLSRLSGSAALALRPVDPLIMAEEAIATLILAADERRIEVSLHAASPQPRVLADPDRLKQVVVNVVGNAVKYCRPGDRVDVSLSAEEGLVVYVVRDTGPGIAAEHLPLVKQRLYRGRRDGDGSGLGLALADQIVRLHGGALEIESTVEGPARGTLVRFSVPIVTATPEQADVAPSTPSLVAG